MPIDRESPAALGGSSRSEASEATANRWKSRPLLGRVVLLVVRVVPIVAAFIVTRIYVSAVIQPTGVLAMVGFLAIALAFSVATLFLVEQHARRLLPLSTLFQMSMVFPDAAPNRFGLALRGDRGGIRTEPGAASTGRSDRVSEELYGLLASLQEHDRFTRGHSERVRAYADLIAEELELSGPERQRLTWAALLHDVGKLAVRPELLNKPAALTASEWEEVRQHPVAADELIGPVQDWLGEWALAATQHHERWDGNGYPNGLAGEEISLAGRIVAVADSFDVMTSARSYKQPLSYAAAREELVANAGSQFDPDVVRAMMNVSVQRFGWRFGSLASIADVGALTWLRELAVAAPKLWSTLGSVATAGVVGAASVSGAVALDPAPVVEPPPPPPVVSSTTLAVTTAPTTTLALATTTTTTVVEPTTSIASNTTSTTNTQATTTTTTAAPTTTATSTPTTEPIPLPPLAVDDDFETRGRQVFNVLANDEVTTADIVRSSLRVVDQPDFGAVSRFTTPGLLIFDPFGMIGTAQFTYEICDADGRCSQALVTIDVIS